LHYTGDTAGARAIDATEEGAGELGHRASFFPAILGKGAFVLLLLLQQRAHDKVEAPTTTPLILPLTVWLMATTL